VIEGRSVILVAVLLDTIKTTLFNYAAWTDVAVVQPELPLTTRAMSGITLAPWKNVP